VLLLLLRALLLPLLLLLQRAVGTCSGNEHRKSM
jgi:hypothetical protein